MQTIPDDLAGASALNVCRTRDGWQASLQVSGNAFRITEAETPALAIALLFGPPLPETMEEFLAQRAPLPCPVALPA